MLKMMKIIEEDGVVKIFYQREKTSRKVSKLLKRTSRGFKNKENCYDMRTESRIFCKKRIGENSGIQKATIFQKIRRKK